MRIKVIVFKAQWFVRPDIDTRYRHGRDHYFAWNDSGYALVIPLK